MGQVIRLEAAGRVGREIARRPEYVSLRRPRKCDIALVATQIAAEADRRRDARLLRGCTELCDMARKGGTLDPELREEIEKGFVDERTAISLAKARRGPKPADPCERCEESEAEVKVTATDLEGTLLDGPERLCRQCATDAGFAVGKS